MVSEEKSNDFRSAIVIAGLILTLTVCRLYSYLLFHSMAEFFSVVVACSIFVVAWNSRRFFQTGYLLWLGIAHLFVGGIDLLHTLAFRGMGVFEGHAVNLPTQLWLSGRFLQAGAWLVATVLVARKPSPERILLFFCCAAAALLLSIFAFDIFPVAYSDAANRLTLFKIVSEYVICLVFLVSGILLWRHREVFDAQVLRFVLLSLVVSILSEVSFTLYQDPFGLANMAGHCLKIVAFYFLYKAVIETGFIRPYDLLFRDLKRSEEALRESQQRLLDINEQLERRVADRTAEAENKASQLRSLAAELTEAEQRERRRLAQVLHDHLQQLLVAARMHLSALKGKLIDHPLDDSVARVDDLIAQSIAASRSLAVELCPPVLYHVGLPAALEWLAEWKKENYKLKVEVQADEKANPANENVRTLVFQSARELLFNVVKHSGTDTARVTLGVCGERLCLVVEDKGKGFDVKLAHGKKNGSFGLFSIQQRLEVIGGSFEVEAERGCGTRVTLTAPLQ